MSDRRPPPPRIGITVGDPRGIGPEIVRAVLTDPPAGARFLVLGPEGVLDGHPAAGRAELLEVGAWDSARTGEVEAGRIAGRAVERAVGLALEGALDGLVTGPISKAALRAAGWDVPGHTELLRDRTGVPDVTMMMAAEETPLGGPIRMALLTGHLPLREVPERLDEALVVRRARIAVEALRDWWGIPTPRIAFAGLNPHASEGGLFGDEEARVLAPAARRLAADGLAAVSGIFPADTVFRRTIEGEDDLVIVPYHDLGLAVLKTVARETGVNVTAGLPFPRTAPDHGTAFDIAGRGVADARSMATALRLCVRFCARRGRVAPSSPGRGPGGPGSPSPRPEPRAGAEAGLP